MFMHEPGLLLNSQVPRFFSLFNFIVKYQNTNWFEKNKFAVNNGHIQNHTFCLLLIFIIALIVITADVAAAASVADTNNDIQLLLIDISTTQLNRLLCLQKLCGVLNNNECDKFVLRKIDSSNKKKVLPFF